jgi:hypothetical protein
VPWKNTAWSPATISLPQAGQLCSPVMGERLRRRLWNRDARRELEAD